MLASVINLNSPAHYFHWGVVYLSLANFLAIVVMLAIFVLALVLPFVHTRRKLGAQEPSGAPLPSKAAHAEIPPGDQTLWTARLRRVWLRKLPPEKLLPDGQPAYVASWIYVFGVLTLAGFALTIITGLILALEGPLWWHTSTVGHFFNSLHLWSVESFMGFMAIHLWGKFWMASWRGRRALTWITGVLAFIVSVFEGFTGYLSQTNFDSQWIAFQAKDAMNASGIGAFFNTMDFGQAFMLHIALVPLFLAAIIVLHIVMVRLRGVVPPIDASLEHLGNPEDPGDSQDLGGRAHAVDLSPAPATSDSHELATSGSEATI